MIAFKLEYSVPKFSLELVECQFKLETQRQSMLLPNRQPRGREPRPASVLFYTTLTFGHPVADQFAEVSQPISRSTIRPGCAEEWSNTLTLLHDVIHQAGNWGRVGKFTLRFEMVNFPSGRCERIHIASISVQSPRELT